MSSTEWWLTCSAVGSILIQIAKNVVGCKRVIGIAGGPDKCKWWVKLRHSDTDDR